MNEILTQLFEQIRKALGRVDVFALVLDPEFQDGVKKIVAAVKRHTKDDA